MDWSFWFMVGTLAYTWKLVFKETKVNWKIFHFIAIFNMLIFFWILYASMDIFNYISYKILIIPCIGISLMYSTYAFMNVENKKA